MLRRMCAYGLALWAFVILGVTLCWFWQGDNPLPPGPGRFAMPNQIPYQSDFLSGRVAGFSKQSTSSGNRCGPFCKEATHG